MLRMILTFLPLLVLLPGCRVIWISGTTATLANEATEVQLPAEISDGWIIVETKINGQGPYRLILDTGAVFGVLGTQVAESLGIEPTFESWITDSGGMRARYPVGFAENAVCGDLTLTRVPFIISDNLEELLQRKEADGMLGYPGFDRLTLDLDYPAGAVRVSTQRLKANEPGTGPLRRVRDETPKARVTLLRNKRSGPQQWMAIDSGGELQISFDTATESLWTQTQRASHPTTAFGLGGAHAKRSVPLRGDLLIAGTRISGVTGKIDAPHNLLGHQLLRHFRVRIDNPGRMVAFTPADPAAKTITMSQPGTLGITQVAKLSDAYLILSIARESPAERAGLQPGDLVWAIDGVPVESGSLLPNDPEADAPPITLTVDRDEVMIDLTLAPEPLFPPNRTGPRPPDLTLPGVRIITTPSGKGLEVNTPDGIIVIPASKDASEP